MALTLAPDTLVGWTPVRVDGRGDSVVVEWCHTDGVPFDDPAFDQTVQRCFRHPFRLLFRHRTDMQELCRFAESHPGLPPAGFVFHTSRCGSTLVSQMLAASSEHLVVAEAGPLDSVLRDETGQPQRLRWMVAALGQRRDARQRRLFVKFDAWSARHLPLVRRAFPDVPWLFLFRDPVEVLVSHARHMGAHVVPGVLPPDLTGVSAEQAAAASPAEYGAMVLAGICEAALACAGDPLGTFVDYRQLPDFVTDELPATWSLVIQAADADRMRSVAANDAKNPVIPFEPDGTAKRAQATPEIRAAAARWLEPLYDRLLARAARP